MFRFLERLKYRICKTHQIDIVKKKLIKYGYVSMEDILYFTGAKNPFSLIYQLRKKHFWKIRTVYKENSRKAKGYYINIFRITFSH